MVTGIVGHLCDNFRMAAVLNLFWNLCLLRVGPADVPPYTWFVVAVVVADIALSTFVGTMLGGGSAGQALALAVVSMAAVAAFTWGGLRLTGQSGRFPATLAALAGSDVLLSLVPAALAPFQALQPLFVIAVFQLWLIVVWGSIYRQAFDTSLAFGIIMAFGVALVATFVVGLALGAVQPAASAGT